MDSVRPLHCRFNPCPASVKNPDHINRLYLGSGTVKQHFRHQVALNATRRYVKLHGATWKGEPVKAALASIDHTLNDESLFTRFCEDLAPYRYLDDTMVHRRP